MKSADYWQKRAEQVANRQHLKADKYITLLRREYDRAIRSIQRDIEVFYQRFAVNNEIDMASSRKLLTSGELKEFRMSLEEFIEKAKDNVDGRWTKELNNAYYKTRISRLEALQIQIRHQIKTLNENVQEGTQALLGDVYKDTYYKTLFEIQKRTGIGTPFSKVHHEAVKKIISKPWVGGNFSQRIWSDREKLLRELEINLSQVFVRGDSVDRTTQSLAKRMNVSYSNAARIVRTETSNIVTEGTIDGYKASGVVKKYEFLATMDERTCEICGPLDGMVFKLSEKQIGVNASPLHPNCRCTTVAYFDSDEGERIAKSEDGKSYYVPANMTYDTWYQKHVVGNKDQ
ncbi:minor capsid protein [Bacillus chungangensis]|uniref:SPP1 gp7 family putative phage head morphogenesis protein n=1 Tax=Bacillus chungangensis TaxID=587633 RepID=A0ABT9WSA5_9BACI|nr:minor capsid protein [Bacillus chungangensis]MDQ0175999.1 SPP1 gp7 family putative phage head morphogenesis protein [Bacillus chungangensis]